MTAAGIHYGAADHTGRRRKKTLDVAPVAFGYNAELTDSPMPNIIDRRNACFALNISSIEQVGPCSLRTCNTPLSKERQHADGYQSN